MVIQKVSHTLSTDEVNLFQNSQILVSSLHKKVHSHSSGTEITDKHRLSATPILIGESIDLKS